MEFPELFRRARGAAEDPYPHQTLIAERGFPELFVSPTGTGKTEAVVLGWLYRLLFHPDEHVRRATPRWLVIALPTRGLVEQTHHRVATWIANVELGSTVATHSVMGGEGWDDRDWRLAPTGPAVFVGTVDMLLSRALNRGYADRRWNWPISFGLFNNGTQWVFDEVQLMEVATKTSRQLQSFRESFGTILPTASTWMSATIDPELLRTVDRREIASTIDAAALTPLPEPLERRIRAPKRVAEVTAPEDKLRYAAELAAAVLQRHRADGLTLVVVNTVERAIATWKALNSEMPKAAEVVLLHRRFRPPDRSAAATRALSQPTSGRIVVSTQVLEAGIDLDATVLVTEAAPWPSLVQRAGRCNRRGARSDAVLAWIEPPSAAPYHEADVEAATGVLRALEGDEVSPASMVDRGPAPRPLVLPVIRRRDLLQLFDTTPDLTGNDVDVSRYIRDGDDRDVYVLWRTSTDPGSGPGGPPHRDELCPAPLPEVRKLIERAGWGKAWRIDHLASRRRQGWVHCRRDDLRPGAIVAVDATAGGYSAATGWSLAERRPVEPVTILDVGGFDTADATLDDEPASTLSRWYGLSRHLADVHDEAGRLLDAMAPELAPDLREACVAAGALHDIGKAHPVWQDAARQVGADGPLEGKGELWAKTGGTGRLRFSQRHFRHELASLLALFGQGEAVLAGVSEPDLVRYLVVAHHGRVRLGLRRIPDERTEDGREVVLGVVEGTTLDRVETPLGVIHPATLSYAVHGSSLVSAWTDRALALRDRPDLGPFRLAFLEAVVRLADWRASHAIEGAST
jgi:CRISPR-associated endonuclease/helicase Cas3